MSGLFPGQKSSTSTTTPSPQAQQIFGQAQAAGAQVPLNLPEGQRLTGAPANQLQFGGLDLQRQAIGTLGPDFGQNIIGLGNRLANPDLNPLLPGAISAATRPVFGAANLANQELLRGAEQFGASGGSAVRGAQAQVAQGAQQQVSDIATQLAFATQESSLNRSLQAGNVIQQGVGLTQLPGSLLSNVGGQLRGLESIESNENLAQFREEQSAPFAALRQIVQALQGFNFGGQTQNVQPLDKNVQLLQFLLGAGALGLGGASLASGNPAGAGLFLGDPLAPFGGGGRQTT